MQYLGDYAASTTIDFMWSSNGADGASITRATNGTISVYKANGTTQTTTGVTDTEDFDSLTGIHHCRIATTDAFYAAANDYMVVLSGATIDGKTVNAVLAMFSIQNRYNPTPPTAAAVADAVWDEARSGHVAAGSFGQGVVVNSIAANAVGAAAVADDAVAKISYAVWDDLQEDHASLSPMTMGGSLSKAAATGTAAEIADAVWDEVVWIDHHLPNSAGLWLTYAKQGTYLFSSDTAADNLKKLVDGTGLAMPNSSIGTAGTVTGTVNANLVNLASTAAVFNSLVALAKGAVPGTVTSGTNTTTIVTASGLSAVSSFYVGKTFIATSGTNAGQGGKLVTAYDGATKRLTIEALTSAMAVGDTFVLVG